MLIDKCKFLSHQDCQVISLIACDVESGNHLIRPRDEHYWKVWRDMCLATRAEDNNTADEKQKEMCEYCRQCQYYSYWRNLPLEKKLFVEEDEE